jgi:hypothetical protein
MLILAVISVVVVIAAAFYLGLQKTAIQDEQKRIEADVASIQNDITALEGQKIEAAQNAQQYLDQVKKDEILWSRVITRIQTLIPTDASQQSKIDILSYSGSVDGKITLNVQSIPAQLEPYEYLAELLSVFNSSSYFSDAYIPSISRAETDNGQKYLSFMFNLKYNENKPAVTTAASSSSDSTTQEKVKVPRP